MKVFVLQRQLAVYSWTFHTTAQLEALNDFREQSELWVNGSC